MIISDGQTCCAAETRGGVRWFGSFRQQRALLWRASYLSFSLPHTYREKLQWILSDAQLTPSHSQLLSSFRLVASFAPAVYMHACRHVAALRHTHTHTHTHTPPRVHVRGRSGWENEMMMVRRADARGRAGEGDRFLSLSLSEVIILSKSVISFACLPVIPPRGP